MVERIEHIVISLSKNSGFTDMENTVQWLRNKGKDPYYFHFKPKNGLPKGSKILFSFEAKIFGRATVFKDIEELSIAEQHKPENRKYKYKYTMILEPINQKNDIAPEPYPKKDLLDLIDQEQFGNLFTYLTPKEFNDICKKIGLSIH